jgi:LIVCS family branched-chain amino acid:cation transporter
MPMEVVLNKTRWFFSGLAMFSMFFGAGNIIFPLIVGQTAQGSVLYALIGLFVTAILIPFSGLIAMTLFQGNYESFFSRMGKFPGQVLIWLILALIGPFGGIPRCISLTYATFNVYFPDLKLTHFSCLFAIGLFFATVRKRKIVDLLGYIFTPVLLVFLFVIVFKGVASSGFNLRAFPMTGIDALSYGLKEGYNTMDLLAAFFFASIVFQRFKQNKGETSSDAETVLEFIKASIVGATLLAFVYGGFAVTSAVFSKELMHCKPDHLLGELGLLLLGSSGGFVVSMAVLLSCLTTAIALTTISADFIRDKVFRNKVTYQTTILLVLALSVLVSSLQFSGIVKVLAPVLQVCYPSLLALCLFNVLHQLYGVKVVKLPVYFILVFVIIGQFI